MCGRATKAALCFVGLLGFPFYVVGRFVSEKAFWVLMALIAFVMLTHRWG